jgi:hypothetical protein
MDKLAENEDIITNAENEIDEVLKGTIMPSMKSLMSDGTRPESYFMDNNGEATPEYIAADSQINSILNSVNPIMREVVRNHANSRLQKLLDSATVAHKKYIVDNLDNLVVNNSPNQIDFASKQAEFELQQSEMIKSRDALAELSIQLRGKHSKKFNDELRAKYDKAFVDYKTKYDATSAIALEMLELKGAPKEYINDLAFDSALDEHKAFTKAEENAFNKINPKMGRVAKWWSKQGIAKKSLYGFSSSTVVTTAVGGALAVTGVGAVAGLAVVFGVKAARTAGMYQLNKNSRSITRFEGNSLVDNKIVESKMRSFKGSNSELGSAITSSLFDVIDTRVESDQKKNRKSLAFVLGSVALGTIAGSVINNVIFDKSAGTGTSGSTTTESGSGNSSSTTLLERPSTSSTVSESSPSSVPNPTETTVSPGSVTDSTSPASVPEVVPTVAPIENIPVVNPLEQQVTLHVPSGQGFENSIQEQFGLSDAQSYEAFTAMKPHLEGQINTYIENGDIRISSPGDMLLNPQASLALQQYLAQVNAESLTELAETT